MLHGEVETRRIIVTDSVQRARIALAHFPAGISALILPKRLLLSWQNSSSNDLLKSLLLSPPYYPPIWNIKLRNTATWQCQGAHCVLDGGLAAFFFILFPAHKPKPHGVKCSLNHWNINPIRLNMPRVASNTADSLQIRCALLSKGRDKPLIIHWAALPHIATEPTSSFPSLASQWSGIWSCSFPGYHFMTQAFWGIFEITKRQLLIWIQTEQICIENVQVYLL